MDHGFYIVPQRQSRAWWDLTEEGKLICSMCGAVASKSDYTICPGCGSKIVIDEEWTKRILERGLTGRRENSRVRKI